MALQQKTSFLTIVGGRQDLTDAPTARSVVLQILHYCESSELLGRLQASWQMYLTQHPEVQSDIFQFLDQVPPEYYAQQTLVVSVHKSSLVMHTPAALFDVPASGADAAPAIQLTPVDSSNIEAVGHASGRLRIKFKGSKTYEYAGVSDDVFHAFMAAESKGQYFKQFIRGKFNSVVVPDPV